MKNNESRLTIAIVGAGGKMGQRIANNLSKKNYKLFFCERGEAGIQRVNDKGWEITSPEESVPVSDVVIMAVPDAALGKLSKKYVPLMQSGSTMITLDPAAAYMGELTVRNDCTFVVTHPCHPPLFGDQDTPEARNDLFGGIAAKQDIVIALLQGEDDKYIQGEKICIEMFSPVVKCHRITVGQMAILEPAAAEVVVASAACLMKDALDEAVKHGVPEEAARAFLLGHIQIPLAIVLKNSNPFSDAAKVAIKYGYENVYKPDWKKVFEPDAIKEVLQEMLHPETEDNKE